MNGDEVISCREQTDTASDDALIHKLFCDSAENIALASIDDALIDMQLQSRELQYRSQYPHASFLIVLRDERPMGRLVVSQHSQSWRLVDIALLSEFQGQGIGTRLMEPLISQARTQSCEILASVMAGNTGAQRFWQRLGFSVTDRQSVYWSLRFRPSG